MPQAVSPSIENPSLTLRGPIVGLDRAIVERSAFDIEQKVAAFFSRLQPSVDDFTKPRVNV